MTRRKPLLWVLLLLILVSVAHADWTDPYGRADIGSVKISVNSMRNVTTLNDSTTDGITTTINVTNTTGYPLSGAVLIDSEVVFYNGIGDQSLLAAYRGLFGTANASHSAGASVTLFTSIIARNSTNANKVVLSDGRQGINVSNPSTALQVGGIVTATAFSGAGTSLTGTAASLTTGGANQLGGQASSYYANTTASCFNNGTNCPTPTAGWVNSSTIIALANNATNVSINNTDLYVDTRNDRVGIGTSTPSSALQVSGTVTASTFSGAGTSLTGTASSLTCGTATSALALNGQSGAYYVNNTVPVCYLNGTNCVIQQSGWLNSSTGNISLQVNTANVSMNNLYVDNTNARVGIGTGTPKNKLDVTGNTNVTGNVTIGGANNRLILFNGTNGCLGKVALVAGSKLVNSSCVTVNSVIFLQSQVWGGLAARSNVTYFLNNQSAGSFGINSTGTADTSVVGWMAVDPVG